jgi:imidazole glycerol-phosphate synthase subunit HisH
MPTVGILDYQAGNIRSIASAFEALGARVEIISHKDQMKNCTHLVLPGVGAFGFCVEKLHESGLLPALHEWAISNNRPTLGICVGMQLLADTGFELGENSGLGWIGGQVRPLEPQPPLIRVPHVGWNNATFIESFGSFNQGDSPDFYFDHSYAYFEPVHGNIVASSSHGVEFAVVVKRRNLVAAQFHPEKSQEAGLRFLSSFLEMSF